MYGGLTNYAQFILYRKDWDQSKGKYTKRPCNVAGQVHDAHDRSIWVSYDQAQQAVNLLGDTYGLGFVFSEDNPFFFLDIDNALIGGQWSPIVHELCSMFPGAYVEVSMSGAGIHIVGSYSQRPDHACRNKDHSLEFYTEARFMALGNPDTAQGDVTTVHDDQLFGMVAKYFNPEGVVTGTQAVNNTEWTTTHDERSRPILNDEALILKAMKSTSASAVFGGQSKATFAQLWTASPELSAFYPPDNDKDEFNRSVADSALATHLMFWTGGDCERTKRLMRSSGLMREKFNRDDYMMWTIAGSRATHGKNGADYYSMTDEVIEVIKPCDAAVDLGEMIQKRLETYINKATNDSIAGQQANINVNLQALDQIITRTFWSGSKSKLYVLTDDNVLNMYVEKDMIRISEKYFGYVVEPTEIELYAERIAQLGLTEDKAPAIEKTLNGIAYNILVDYLKMKNQRDKLRSRVDMFAKRPRMEWFNDSVTNVYIWHPVKADCEPQQQIVEDYIQHFPMCDNLLQQIVAARFASDRKNCFTWLRADSDWGKGLFTGALRDLGLLVELSVAETEKAFEGSPMAKDASLFTHAFIVNFNEFKMVKSELKQIENELPISPKNQLMQTVDIYHKLFTSAESVDSLAGEAGVEDQFANRFSYIDGKGSIGQRHMFNTVGKYTYFKSIKAMIANRINELVTYYVSLGEEESCIHADRFVDEFHSKYGIGQTFERVSSNLPNIVQSFKEWVISTLSSGFHGGETDLYFHEGAYFLKRSASIFERWVEETYGRAEKFTILKKKKEILHQMGEGKPVTVHRINGRGIKSLRFTYNEV